MLESNPGHMGQKHERYLCALPSPQLTCFQNVALQVINRISPTFSLGVHFCPGQHFHSAFECASTNSFRLTYSHEKLVRWTDLNPLSLIHEQATTTAQVFVFNILIGSSLNVRCHLKLFCAAQNFSTV